MGLGSTDQFAACWELGRTSGERACKVSFAQAVGTCVKSSPSPTTAVNIASPLPFHRQSQKGCGSLIWNIQFFKVSGQSSLLKGHMVDVSHIDKRKNKLLNC